MNGIYIGDCLEVMAGFPDNSIDLIVTSPPYADARKHTYGGVPPTEYVDWFCTRAVEIVNDHQETDVFVKMDIENGRFE